MENNQKVDVISSKRFRIKTIKGDILFEFYSKQSPITTNYFKGLVKTNEFSKLFVSRVLNNEVVQISPLNSFNLEANTQSNVVYEKNNLIFKKGSVALARDIHDNNSASFDFFITLKAKPLLDRKYVIFAKVIEGFDTLYNLKKNDKIIYTSLE